MLNSMLVTLINKNVVQSGTTVSIYRSAPALGGYGTVRVQEEVTVIKATIDESGTARLLAENVFDKTKYKIKAENIRTLDGMKPHILAGVFGIDEDGTLKPEGKKRGRKPKNKRE